MSPQGVAIMNNVKQARVEIRVARNIIRRYLKDHSRRMYPSSYECEIAEEMQFANRRLLSALKRLPKS
jgi:hypothetical protein